MLSTSSITKQTIERPEAKNTSSKPCLNLPPSNNALYKPSTLDLALVFGSCIDFPLSLFSSISAALIKDPNKPVNLGSDYLNSFLHFTANLYPLSLIFSSFLGLMQGIISASPMRTLTYLLVAPSMLFGVAPAEFKAMSLSEKIGFLKDRHLEKQNQPELDNLYKQLKDNNAFLSFFIKSPYILFLVLTFMSHFSDISRDHPSGKDFAAKPFIPSEVKNFKGYARLFKENAIQEWQAFINSFEVFNLKKIRWTFMGKNPKVEEEIKLKNYTGFNAGLMRISSCSLKAVLSYSVIFLRIATAGLFAYIASKAGKYIFNQNSNLFDKDDQKKLDQDPKIKNLYEFANKLYSLSFLCGGITTILSLSPGYLHTSGFKAAFVKMASGGLLVFTALSNLLHLPENIGRTVFYAAGPLYLLSHALRIIFRMQQYYKINGGLTMAGMRA